LDLVLTIVFYIFSILAGVGALAAAGGLGSAAGRASR